MVLSQSLPRKRAAGTLQRRDVFASPARCLFGARQLKVLFAVGVAGSWCAASWYDCAAWTATRAHPFARSSPRAALGPANAADRRTQHWSAFVQRENAGHRPLAASLQRRGNAKSPVIARALEEYWQVGEQMLELRLDHGGALRVTRHVPKDELPSGLPPGTTHEWRVLRFQPDVGSTDLVQSITKVHIAPEVSPEPRTRMLSDVLPLEYTKSMIAGVLPALALFGANVLPGNATAGDSAKPLRLLCIGLGGATIPTFCTQMLPQCEVDVVELEPAVVKAALEGMGVVQTDRLRIVVDDGAAFALRTAKQSDAAAYDAVLIDAYDAAGNVPEPLWGLGGDLATALSKGLLRRQGGLVAINLLPQVDAGPIVQAYREALCEFDAGVAFSIESERTNNQIVVQTCGGGDAAALLHDTDELRYRLASVAAALDDAISSPFKLQTLAVRGLRVWPAEKDALAGGPTLAVD